MSNWLKDCSKKKTQTFKRILIINNSPKMQSKDKGNLTKDMRPRLVQQEHSKNQTLPSLMRLHMCCAACLFALQRFLLY